MNKRVGTIISNLKKRTRSIRNNLKERVLPFNFIFPSLITISALCFGITAIRFAMFGLYERAMLCILIAALLDLFDGRVARILGVSSTFGAELDSLSDAVCFGVAPAITVYMWGLYGNLFGWTISLFFAVCGVLRLARFNTMLYEAPKTKTTNADYFTGVPIPAAAYLALMPIVMQNVAYAYDMALPINWLSALFLIGGGFLMVSTIPTLSTKKMHISKNQLVPVLAVIGLVTAFIITQPQISYLLIGTTYLLTIPYTWHKAKREQSR